MQDQLTVFPFPIPVKQGRVPLRHPPGGCRSLLQEDLSKEKARKVQVQEGKDGRGMDQDPDGVEQGFQGRHRRGRRRHEQPQGMRGEIPEPRNGRTL